MIRQLEPSARNWIALWRAKNLPNPYRQPEKTLYEEVVEGEAKLDILKEKAKEAKEILKSAPTETVLDVGAAPMTPQQAAAYGTLVKYAGLKRWVEEQKKSPEYKEEAKWAQPRPTAEGGFEIGRPEEPKPPRPTMPEIPQWLQRVSGITGRVPEQRVPIQRPSGQMWARLTPTQRAMYAGLADWAAKLPFEDIIAEMERQVPRTPRIPTRWTPARQMV
jgi:hypothetical protein